MSERNNTYNNISYYSPEINSNEYTSFSTCGHRIAQHLNSLNVTLQQLDEDLVQYRKSVKSDIYLNDLSGYTEERLELIKKIKTELRIYHL